MGFHFGLHLKRMSIVFAIIVSIFGMYAFIHENFLLYISGQAHFIMFHDGQPAVFYVIELFAIWGMTASAAFTLKQLFTKRSRKKVQ